jgi:hypothetical protein
VLEDHAVGNPDVTIAIVPRGNHRMLVPGTKELVAGYLDLLADWAARRVAQSQRIAKPVSERQGYLSFGLALGNT